ncbi:Beta-barrel assembly-enhancing protease [Halioglobus japonicus]|nr:Beta-barrel assembly-enhancing protease [Halioglobus japonicus]
MAGKTKKVLIIGWDGADWKVASPLMDAGKMPHLKRFVDEGVMGNLSTLYPILSPMLWTSIATGKRAHKHGIYGFIEPDPNNGAVRPITNLGRKCKAIWNILNQSGYRSNVVGWWPSHPAEPINGVMVSNHFQASTAPADKPWPMKAGTVHPPDLIAQLAKFRVHPGEIQGEQLLPFVPNAANVDQNEDGRLQGLAKIIAETAGVQAAATAIMQHEPWDFMAVYFDAIDHFCHGFMKYHPPREKWVDEKDFEMYNNVINMAYQFHDVMLGAMMELIDDDTTVIIVSDHGFHPDHLRPKMIGNEPAGPADEHRQFGIVAMHGPDIKQDELIFGASLLDITPTVLSLFGLPVGQDMDGKALTSAFVTDPGVSFVESWENLEGEDGRHPPDAQVDSIDAHESLQQLIDLGYIDEIDEDKDTAAVNAKRELRYNLARDYFDARKIPEAAKEFEALWEECPEESRFGVKLFTSWLIAGNTDKAEETLNRLYEQKKAAAQEARNQLKALKEARELESEREPISELTGDPEELEKRKRDSLTMRKLVRQSQINPNAFSYFRGCLLYAQGKFEEALQTLKNAEHVQVYNQPSLKMKMGECYLALRMFTEARQLFQDILDIDPISPDAQLGFAQCELGEKQPRKAYQSASSALGLVYHNPKAHYIAARAMCELGRLEKAIDHLQTAIAQSPGFPDGHRLLEAIYEKQGKHESALAQRLLAESAQQRLDERKAGTAVPEEKDELAGFAMEESIGIGSFEGKHAAAENPLIIVSGLPRSGTSMMMQMLSAGGVDICVDDKRPADESNPKGYFEFEPVKKLDASSEWIKDAGGKAVKIVAQLLPRVPRARPKRVIFMARPLTEIVSSQSRMLDRLGRKGASLSEQQLAATYKKQVESVSRTLSEHDKLAAITIDYAASISDPQATARRVNAFLGGNLDENAMAAVIDSALYRERL